MLDIDELIRIIEENRLLERFNLSKIGIFGSILNTDNPNDIDILVDEYRHFTDLEGLRNMLEELTGKPVDIVIEKYANPIILYRAKRFMHSIHIHPQCL